MSSDSSSSPPPPPDSSSSSKSQSPPPPTKNPPPPPASSPPPPPFSSPPPPPPSSSPPPPSSSPPPPAPSNSGGKSSTPPPSGKDKNKSPPSDKNNNISSLRPKSRSSPPSPPSRSKNNRSRSNAPQLKDRSAKNDNSSNQAAIIAGVTAGAVLLLAVLIASVICCCRKKKRKNTNHDLQYYRDSNKPHENMNNYNNNTTPGEYMVKIPPPPAPAPAPASVGVSSEFGWTPAPPPPPPHFNSSEMSSAGFSGPYQPPLPPPHPAVALGFNQSSFTYEDLSAATGGFAAANLLGQGGFGFVHKGVLPNGKEIAVKSLKLNSGQGEREFHAEVDIISRVHHRHLVSLVGYCSTGSQRLLVYEFVDNGTLEQHLHGTGKPFLNWATRHQIALGAAKGFAYLHEDCHPRIIHRDIKAANILIDSNCEAKVADFGLAKLSNDNHTHVSTRIMGTFGYLAPEYASSGKLTEKSDVYSFGVMLLELITGRRPINIENNDDDSLVDWARPILMRVQEGGRYEELVDPQLGNNYDPNEMLHMVNCAASCIRHSARGRPKMSQIVRALEGNVSLDDMNNGPKITSTHMSSTGSDYDMRYGKGAISSQDYSSSEDHTMDFQSRS